MRYLFLFLVLLIPACDKMKAAMDNRDQEVLNNVYEGLMNQIIQADVNHKKFTIISAGWHKGVLGQVVEQSISDGWEPVGGIVPDKYGDGVFDVTYSQSLRKVNPDIVLLKSLDGHYKFYDNKHPCKSK